jgi:hypothetical protein
MAWHNISSFKELYDFLSDQFKRDFREAISWERFAYEGMTAEDIDGMYQDQSLEEAFETLIEETSGWEYDLDSWDASGMNRVLLAMYLMIYKNPEIERFTYSFSSEEQFEMIREKMEELIVDYGMPPSFRDVVDEQLGEAEWNWEADRSIGVSKPVRF